MKKKRSIGVTIFGRIFVAIGVTFGLLGILILSLSIFLSVTGEIRLDVLQANIQGFVFFGVIPSGVYISIGMGILNLKSWIRKTLVPFLVIVLIATPFPVVCFMVVIQKQILLLNLIFYSGLFYCLFILASLIFFIRPKVKEQFKKQNN